MKRHNGLITAAAFIAAVVLVTIRMLYFSASTIDNVLSVKALENGETLLAVTEDNRVEIYLLRDNGSVRETLSFSRRQGDRQLNLLDMTMDDTGRVYVLRDIVDARTGNFLEQDLWIYRTNGFYLGAASTVALRTDATAAPVRYKWLSMSSALVLIGTGGERGGMQRAAYDLDTLRDNGQVAVKSNRAYPIASKQDVYTAIPSGSNIAYIARSGRVFFSGENAGAAREVYPGREDEQKLLNYATFIAPASSGSVYIGEGNSGDILRLELSSGTAQTVRNGSDALTDNGNYRVKDVAILSMRDEKNFSAIVKNDATGTFAVVINHDGKQNAVEALDDGAVGRVMGWILRFLLYFAGFELICMAVGAIFRRILYSRTILLKLVFSTLPLLVMALVLFGTYSYQSYRENIEDNFKKQVQDEGSLLAALFGAESFNQISHPMAYNNTDYEYLSRQMATRDIHTDTAYFETDTLYTGVSEEYPPFFSFDITANKEKEALYRKAALRGEAQTGLIEDGAGRRIACVTPIGGTSGTTIFLLETSRSTTNMEEYTNAFIRNYLLASGLFLVAVCLLLLYTFTRILTPLEKIIDGLERFSAGKRDTRLPTNTNDELADISRVFNKMASDIDVEIYKLESMSETYYRFIPQRIFQLLEKENLGDIQFGNAVRGQYSILCVNLNIRQGTGGFDGIRELTNQFFGILNRVCDAHNATLLSDSVNLQDLRVVCPDTDSAVSVAMDAIAQVDGYNATCPVNMRLDVSFFLHRAEMSFSICGDDNRYIPTLVCSELEWLTRRCEGFRQISSRLIVTSAAYENIETDGHFSRFIGYVDAQDGTLVGLYDFFDSCPPALIRLLNDTRGAFDKAMQLYQDERYYEAKNLFTVVLRENQYDNVARHYIFQCERKMQREPVSP
ncbi:HAMP domain-containing protein [Ruminococcaceae bacterium OttesenSCG-928-L11]|nr:HAMP domain-containing protein [Ruminococcaceae bacterium OttesenSCG-928-L11]